jgi:O-antigen/teichoic acid export membrane protein
MSRKKINRGLILGFIAYGTDAIVSTMLFPLLIKYMGKSEAGVWMLYSSLGAMFACLLAGSGPVVARATAMALGEIGLQGGKALAQVRVQGQRLYGQIMSVIALAGLVAALFYLPNVATESGLSRSWVLVGWAAFMLGWSARAIAGLRFSHLDGVGEIGYNRALGSVAGICNIAVLWLILPHGLGIMAPAAVYAVVALGLMGAAGVLCRKKMPPAFWGVPTAVSDGPMLKDSLKMLVLSFTTYVTTQSCIVLVERSEGTATLATFAPVVRLAVLIAGAASLPATMLFPYLSRLYTEGDHTRYRRLCLVVMFVPPALFFLPGLALVLFPAQIIGTWLGAENYVGDATVRLIVLYGFLFTLHSAFATPAVAIRARTFVRESLLNMALVACLMPLLASYYGVAGYPLGMLLGTIVPSMMVLYQSVKVLRFGLEPSPPI